MNAEPGNSEPREREDADAWLDGLAGRAGSDAHAGAAEGQQLRRALLSAGEQTRPGPSWSEIERLADAQGMATQLQQAPAQPARVADAPPNAPRAAASAANDNQWRAPLRLAAAVVLGAVAMLLWEPWRTPASDTTLRGINAPSDAARWQVADPAAAAASLAAELRALGAQVMVQTEADGALLLQVNAPAAAQAAVNQRLVVLETALDAQGQLRLRVQAP